MPPRRVMVLVLVLVAAGAAVTLPRLRPSTFNGTALPASSPAHDFTLESDRGPVSLAGFRGRAVLLFFGYTSCPDICPTTMAKLRQVTEGLGEERRDVQVILVTVDPAVDTPHRLREYVRAFDPGFIGLGGERAELAEVARSFGAWGGEPQQAPAPAAPSHEGHGAPGPGPERIIPHTSHVFGLDRDGRFRLLWSPDLTAEQIADDVRGLLRL
ncbi:MAG TPA: SCO family protein [Longimicrobiales bacterium]|nr:SCO family protein [Longimicrobiales bacterium]